MLSYNCSYIESLKVLAEMTGVPWPTLNAAESARLRQVSAAVPQLAQDIADWANGLRIWAEQRKAGLAEAAGIVAESRSIEVARYFNKQIATLRPSLSIGSINPGTLALSFAELKRKNPGVVNRFMSIGRDDREHAEFVTAGIVRTLAGAQRMESSFGGQIS
ncbi:MAG TPA: hypothetical protein VG297_24255 [Bryobacteraceae bacterium]|jgi:hypothetical protein|nr:hypothetical protein [Bryobacteraceae bacterium]